MAGLAIGCLALADLVSRGAHLSEDAGFLRFQLAALGVAAVVFGPVYYLIARWRTRRDRPDRRRVARGMAAYVGMAIPLAWVVAMFLLRLFLPPAAWESLTRGPLGPVASWGPLALGFAGLWLIGFAGILIAYAQYYRSLGAQGAAGDAAQEG
jgi:hypothetical protein